MMGQDELLDILDKRYSTDNKGDYFHVTTALTSGVVVDVDDPLQQGRLRVFCPSHSDNPGKIHLLPWAVYVSPFGGTISNETFMRNGKSTKGSTTYGFWAIPELGANVLVGCIDSDLRRRFWMGTMYDQQETHTIGNGRYSWSSGGNVDGPLSSAGSPIQPAYDNASTAFDGKKDSPEWQSREVEYSITAIDKTLSQPPTPDKASYLDQQDDEISAAQQFEFNRDRVGSNGYGWSGFDGLPFRASKVIAISSPGFASFTMDDRQFNSRTKLRSSTGHMVLLDDTNDRIYIKTNTGNAWMEMDSAGNIDGYSSRRISMQSDMDINLTAKKSIRLTAAENIFMYAGGDSGLAKLTEPAIPGEIRIQSQKDMHLVSDNLRVLSFADTIFEIGGSKCESIGGTSSTQVQGDINLITNAGDFNTTINGNYNLSVTEKINEFAISGASFSSHGDLNFYAYYGKVNIGAQQDITAKTVSGNVNIQAVGGNSGGSGKINIKAPNSQVSVSDQGASISTNGDMNIQSGGNTSMQSNSPTAQTQPFPDASQVPSPSCSLGSTVPTDGFTGVDLAARVAWNAGFRGQSLTIAVAIAGAESRFNPNAIGDVSLETDKWGPSCGFWQVRSLKNPSSFSAPDNLRVNPDLFDPQKNAIAAYAFSKQGTNFGAWSTYTGSQYLNSNNMTPAVTAIENMCAGTPPASSDALFNPLSVEGISNDTDIIQSLGCIGLSSLQIGSAGITLQSLQDIGMKSLGMVNSTEMFTSVVPKINEIALQLDTLAYYSSLAIAIIGQITGHTISFPVNASDILALIPGIPSEFGAILGLIDSGICLQLPQLPSNFMPYLDGPAETILNFENFNLNGKTILP